MPDSIIFFVHFQERLEPKFQELSLGSGVIGEQPSLSTMKSVLTEWDAYMYCGHGSSLKNVPFHVCFLLQTTY